MNRRLVTLAASTVCALAVASTTFAKDSTPSIGVGIGVGVKPWFDLHNYSRAVAFGSVQLAQGGSDVATWKAVNARQSCRMPGAGTVTFIGTSTSTSIETGTDVEAGPLPGDGAAGHDGADETGPGSPITPGTGTIDCTWSVLVTTAYHLVECDDGSAHLARSGTGVTLVSRTEGETFGWAEATACRNGGIEAHAGTDKDRPLDWDSIRKTAK